MWRPEDWPKCPCDGCTAENKLVDEYGYLCDISCGQHSAWVQKESGADAMLEALKERSLAHLRGENTFQGMSFKEYGFLVFIPEE
ncbi:MAG: hypothetical protein KKD77_22075 [Gammaproteobacteria bacterium]|nr:hypothetical protein [Gammaproteobacteria bacterium]